MVILIIITLTTREIIEDKLQVICLCLCLQPPPKDQIRKQANNRIMKSNSISTLNFLLLATSLISTILASSLPMSDSKMLKSFERTDFSDEIMNLDMVFGQPSDEKSMKGKGGDKEDKKKKKKKDKKHRRHHSSTTSSSGDDEISTSKPVAPAPPPARQSRDTPDNVVRQQGTAAPAPKEPEHRDGSITVDGPIRRKPLIFPN